LLAAPPHQRDRGLSDAALDAVLAQTLLDKQPTPDDGPLPAVVAFRAIAPGLVALSRAERRLLTEWLDRVLSEGVELD
jgi:hypothetical protein